LRAAAESLRGARIIPGPPGPVNCIVWID